MARLFLMFNHQLTLKQEQDAQKVLDVDMFIEIPDDLRFLWANIPSELSSLKQYLTAIKTYLKSTAREGDYLLVQGDFGATYQMVNYAKMLGIIPLYATTRRKTIESEEDGKIIKKSIFEHERFRTYED